MKTTITKLKLNPIFRYVALICCVFVCSISFFSSVFNSVTSSESELQINNFFNPRQFSFQDIPTNNTSLEVFKENIPESTPNYLLVFEPDVNEEEIEVQESGEISTHNFLHKSVPISKILNNYSHQLSKRRVIPLFVLYSSWKSYINS